MFGKNKLLFISIIISIIFHLLFFISVFYLLKPKKVENKIVKRKEIYIYLPKKEIKKESKIIKNKLKVPKSEKKGNKLIKKNAVKVRKKKVSKSRKIIKKSNNKIIKRNVDRKIVLKKEQKIEKTTKEKNLSEKVDKKTPLENEIDTTNTTNSIGSENRKKLLSIKDLAGKEKIFELGKKSVTEEELNRDEDIQEYIRALTKYLNQLARRKDLYPPMAKRLKLEGSLIIRFTIKKDGSIDENSIQIIISSGYNVLDKGAIKIIKRYVPLFAKKYNKYPPKDNFTVELPITFEIINW